MTREEVIKILESLDVSIFDAAYEIRLKLKELNLDKDIVVSNGISKICLIFNKADFVIKWTPYIESFEKSEAYREFEIYNKAKECNIEKLFPYTEVLIIIHDIAFILQEKIDYSAGQIPLKKQEKYQEITKTVKTKIYHKFEESLEIKNDVCNRDLNMTWAKMVIALYGKQICKNLAKFIQDNKINDLHEENIGYKNNKPILLDFSGYYR